MDKVVKSSMDRWGGYVQVTLSADVFAVMLMTDHPGKNFYYNNLEVGGHTPYEKPTSLEIMRALVVAEEELLLVRACRASEGYNSYWDDRIAKANECLQSLNDFMEGQ